ncbi:MAG: response regulator [bacterium]
MENEQNTNQPTEQGSKLAKVLVVEDDKFLRDLLVRKLKEENFEIETAIDGVEAIKKADEWMPNLILLDLIIPGLDGFEVLKQLKENPNTNKIPTVILSNLGQQEEIQKGMGLGASDYLVKAHLTPGEIIDKVKGLLE